MYFLKTAMKIIILVFICVFPFCLNAQIFQMAPEDKFNSPYGHILKYDKVEHAIRSAAIATLLKKTIYKNNTNKVFLLTLAVDILWEIRDGINQPKGDGFSVLDLIAGTVGNMVAVSIKF